MTPLSGIWSREIKDSKMLRKTSQFCGGIAKAAAETAALCVITYGDLTAHLFRRHASIVTLFSLSLLDMHASASDGHGGASPVINAASVNLP